MLARQGQHISCSAASNTVLGPSDQGKGKGEHQRAQKSELEDTDDNESDLEDDDSELEDDGSAWEDDDSDCEYEEKHASSRSRGSTPPVRQPIQVTAKPQNDDDSDYEDDDDSDWEYEDEDESEASVPPVRQPMQARAMPKMVKGTTPPLEAAAAVASEAKQPPATDAEWKPGSYEGLGHYSKRVRSAGTRSALLHAATCESEHFRLRMSCFLCTMSPSISSMQVGTQVSVIDSN